MISEELAGKIIKLIAHNPNLLSKLDMPNINFPTLGGKVWWRDLAECDGWRIQQSSVTKHCRILDPNNIRKAWGGESAMMSLFNKMT